MFYYVPEVLAHSLSKFWLRYFFLSDHNKNLMELYIRNTIQFYSLDRGINKVIIYFFVQIPNAIQIKSIIIRSVVGNPKETTRVKVQYTRFKI